MILSFLFALACAYLCYSIAKKNNRNIYIAAVLGFIFPLFAVIGYIILGKK